MAADALVPCIARQSLAMSDMIRINKSLLLIDFNMFKYLWSPLSVSCSLHADLFQHNINIYIIYKCIKTHLLSFLYTDMVQVIDILPNGKQGPVYLTVNTMAADGLAMQWAG